jgi:hypothetical protein
MTRAQARKKGWALWIPQGGSALVGQHLSGDGAKKLDGGMWMDEHDKFQCWDSEFDEKFGSKKSSERH